MTDAPPAVDPRVARRVITLVFLTVFLDLIGFGVIIPLMPLYVKTMGGDAQTVGVILGCFSFTQLLATPVLGRLSDRYGRRPVILLSLAGNALSMVVFAFATRANMLPLLFVSRIVAGATAGNLSACQAAVADVTTERDRAKAMGAIGAGIGLGMVLGPLLGSVLSAHGGWAPPLAAAALAVLDLLGALVLMPETRRASDVRAAGPLGVPGSSGHPGLRAALSTPAMVLVLALYFLTFLCMTNMQVALPLLAKERLNWGAPEVGRIFGLMGVAGLVVQGGLIGPLSRSLGTFNLLVVGALLQGIGLAGIAGAHEAWTMYTAVLFQGLGMGVMHPSLSAVATEVTDPAQRGTVLGVAQSSGGLARTVGPVWSGLLYARISPPSPFLAGSVAAAVAVLLAVRLKIRVAARP